MLRNAAHTLFFHVPHMKISLIYLQSLAQLKQNKIRYRVQGNLLQPFFRDKQDCVAIVCLRRQHLFTCTLLSFNNQRVKGLLVCCGFVLRVQLQHSVCDSVGSVYL